MPQPPNAPRLVAHGMAVGLHTISGLDFNIHADYTYCRLCGAVYQGKLDRANAQLGESLNDCSSVEALSTLSRLYQKSLMVAREQRQQWSRNHAKGHSDLEHQMLAFSSRWVTPEAAHVLAAFGIVPLSDMVFDDEIEEALSESSPIPQDDAEY